VDLSGTKKRPHPERVEERTPPIQFSCKRLMRLANLCASPSAFAGVTNTNVAPSSNPALAVLPEDRESFDFSMISASDDLWRACALAALGVRVSESPVDLSLHDAVVHAESTLTTLYR
jgi:hypothetical protein